MIYAHSVSFSLLGRVIGRRSLLALVLAGCVVPVTARADESGDGLLVPGQLVPVSWENGSAGATPAPAATPGPTDAVEMSLAQRVEELERTIRQLQSVQTAAAEESLPAMGDAAQLAAEPECEEIEVIVKPTFKWRGRIYFDSVTYDDDDATAAFFNTDRENEFGFDTARLGVQGDIYENILYVAEIEFEGTEVDFKDVFMEMHSLPCVGRFRAGHFKEPIGLEEMTSSRFDTFMEQSYATHTFTPGRSYGIEMFNDLDPCQECTWFLGMFRHDSDDSPSGHGGQWDDRNDYSFDSRFVWLPYYDEPSEGRYLVHLGGSYSYRNSVEPAIFETGAYVGNQPPIGVGAMAQSDTWNQLGLEMAVVWGALSVQSEYFEAFVTSGERYRGAYTQVSYFLTGEHRGYNKTSKAFDRVYPFEPAFWVDTCRGGGCGRGAWELAAGYSYSNLRDGQDIQPGVQERAFVDGFVVGTNWYLNPYSRVMFDYNFEVTDFVDANTPDSHANIFGIRWQVDW